MAKSVRNLIVEDSEATDGNKFSGLSLSEGGALLVEIVGSGGGSVNWGTILGTLSAQVDLQAALDAKATPSDITTALSNHTADSDPHPTYTTATELATGISNHAGAADPHTSYQLESEKAAANGYASLDATTKVPVAQLGTGTPTGSLFLRDDRTWAAPAGGGGGGVEYLINVMAASLSTTTDAATYYFGCLAGLAPQTTANLAPVYILKAGTIKGAEIWARAATAGTAENISVYIRKNNTTDTLVQTLGAATATRRFTNVALNVAVAVGDWIEVKVVCPTWATNPATVAFGGSIFVEV